MSKQSTIRVQVNPARRVGGPTGQPLTVHDPRSGKLFPDKPFDLPRSALQDPRILRLFPPADQGGFAGGRYGDLVVVPAKSNPKAED